MIAALAVLEHRAAVLNGNLGAAAEVAEWFGRAAGETGETLLLKAWAEAAAGRYEQVRKIVGHMLEPGMPFLLPQTVVEAHLLAAEAALQADDRRSGWESLEVALAVAEGIGVVRPLALAGPRTQDLLTARAQLNGIGEFATRLARARATIVPDAAVPLSERELAVLALLPSLLSAREIAAEFTVSVNTVKSHIRSIYAKLGVSTRREAVRHAQERGLVP
jgi:LuxR family maltose regulon positive regulatory protein